MQGSPRTRAIVTAAALTATAVVVAACGGAAPVGVPGAFTNHPCKGAVDAALAPAGIAVNDLSNVVWETDITGTGVDRHLLGYRFQGRPPSCSDGDVTASLWPNCGIQQIRTRGDCKLPGL